MWDYRDFDIRNEQKSIPIPIGIAYQQWFNFLLSGSSPAGSIKKYISLAHLPASFHEECFYFCITGVPKAIYTQALGYEPMEYLNVFGTIRIGLLNLLEQCDYLADVFLLSQYNEKQFGIIMSPGVQPAYSAEEMAMKINDFVQSEYERTIFAHNRRYCNVTSLSDAYHNYDHLYKSYLQARVLQQIAFFYMHPMVITQKHLSEILTPCDQRVIVDICEQMFQQVDIGNNESSQLLLNRIIMFYIRPSCDKDVLHAILHLCLYQFQFRCIARNIPYPFDESTEAFIRQCNRIEECVERILPVIDTLCCAVREQGFYNKTILSALYYIRTHYTKDISVADIAAYAGVTPSYMSSEFKKTLKLSIRDYITDRRMEKAMALLIENQGLRLNGLCEQIGIHDPKYFMRVFKQHTGMTPTEYRKGVDAHSTAEAGINI